MKKKLVVKAFIEALMSFHQDVKVMKRYFRDKRLTQAEKKILECWLLLRQSRHQEILDILLPLKTSYDLMVSCQKELLLGITYNNKGDFLKSIFFIEKSLEVLPEFSIPRLTFMAQYNLFVAHFNLKNKNGMKKCLQQMKLYQSPNESQLISYLKCEFDYLFSLGKIVEAEDLLEDLESKRLKMNDPMLASFLITKYMFYVKTDNYSACSEALAQMKKCRLFYHSPNYLYMKYMLEHFLHDSPLYIYENQFKDCSFLFYQLKVIQSLEEGKIEQARSYWEKLQVMNPKVYKNMFSYEGDKCIFSLCLSKHQQRLVKLEIRNSFNGTKEEKFLSILKQSSTPVPIEEIYQMIWNKQILEKSDFDKLKRLVSRIRQNKEIEIKYKKGCYCLTGFKKSA